MQGQLSCEYKSILTLPFTELTGDDVFPFLKIPKFSFDANSSMVSLFYCVSGDRLTVNRPVLIFLARNFSASLELFCFIKLVFFWGRLGRGEPCSETDVAL